MAKNPDQAFTWGDARQYTKEIKERYPTRVEVTAEIGESEPKALGRVEIITCIKKGPRA